MDEDKRKWYQLDPRTVSNLIVVCAGILLYLGLTHLPQVRAVVGSLLDVLSPFIGGFVIAYLLNTPANFFQRKVFKSRRHSRVLAIVAVYLIALLGFILLFSLVMPQVGQSVMSLVNNLSGYLENLTRLIQELTERFDIQWDGLSGLVDDYRSILSKALGYLSASITDILGFGMAVGNGVVNALTALIASIYMLSGKDRLVRQLKKLIYALFPAKGSSHILSTASRANTIFVGFINGKLVDSAIMGVLCFLCATLLKIPYAVLVSVVVGLTNIIPFFGPIIGAVPCVMILLIVDPWAALRFLVLIVVLQQFDGNILGPKILGNSTGLSAMWVLVAIVVGGGLFGFVGMLLGVPTFAVLYSLMREWADKRLARKGVDANGQPVGQEAPPQAAATRDAGER